MPSEPLIGGAAGAPVKDVTTANFMAEVPTPTGAFGVAVAVNGKITAADLFDKAETLTKLWPKLVRAFALDAFEEEAPAEPVTTIGIAPPRPGSWSRRDPGQT